MGTRGAYGFRVEGVDKVTYNHGDSYPTGLGFTMVDAIAGASDEDLLRAAVGLQMVAEDGTPSAEDIERYEGVSLNTGVGEGRADNWYCLLREFQGVPQAMLSGLQGHAIDSHEFLADSLFCEWAYIVNMDTRKLEVHKGFNRSRQAPGRYADAVRDGYNREHEFYGVTLVAEIDLDDIRAGKGRDAMTTIEGTDADEDEDAA